MRRRNLLLVLLISLSSFSFGQTLIYTRVVQGNLFLPPGTPAQNSKMRFQLKYCAGQVGRVPVNPGNPPGPTGITVSYAPFDVTVQSDGSWRTQIYGNDQIICGTDMTGPSRWLIQPVFNGQANAGVEYQIQSCGAASPCQPFSPDSAPRCSLTVVTDCAVESGNPDEPDTTVTVNAVMAVPNAINFGNILLPPTNGKVINFMLSGNQAGAYIPGNGNSSTCLSGTGSYVLCGSSGGGGGVTGATAGGGLVLSGSTLGMIRTCSTNQYLSWNGASWVCATLSGGGGGGLPTTTQYDLFASTGSGGGQASGILGGGGFLKGQVILATGDVSSAAAPFPLAPNASVEYFPNGATFGGINLGATNGLAAYFSHSGKTAAAPGYGNGGVMLGGGNSSGTNYQVYVDCESAPLGCDFKVPISVNGGAVGGGGGGGGLPTIPTWNIYASNGSGGAQDSGVAAETGFLRANVLEASGAGGSAPAGFTPPNGSIEYFPTGATYGGINIGTTNGVAIHFSHSNKATGSAGNGGVALGGGNATGTASTYQIYVDCEQAGCDFKVPPTYLGATIGGIAGATANGGLVATANTLGLLTTCSANQILQWSGSAWVCATNVTGTTVQVGGVGMGALANFTSTAAPTNGRSVSFASSGTSVSAALIGDGSTNCLSGTGTYVACGGPAPNQTTGVFTNQTSATLTSTTTALVWSCYDNNTPANAIYPSNVSIDPSTFIVTFTFSVPQTGQCVVNSSGGGGGGGGGGGSLPTIPVQHLFASTGSAGAQDSNVLAAPNVGGTGLGVIKSGASIVGGMIGGTSPFTGSNGSQEWYGQGGVIGSVTVANGAVLVMGNSSLTTGAVGNGGVVLGGNSATTTSSKEVYVDCEHTGCDFKAPITVNGGAVGGGGGGSGTVSSGTANQFAWYAATGTTVSSNAHLTDNGTITSTETVAAPGLNVTGSGGIAMTGAGAALPAPAASSGGIGIGPGGVPSYYSNGGTWTAIGSGGGPTIYTCTIAADTSFTSTQATICSQALGATARQWRVHCSIPWNFTGGSGTSNVVIGINLSATPSYQTYVSPVMWNSTGSSNMGAVAVSASGNTPLVTANGLTAGAGGTIFTVNIDGTVAAAANTTFYIYGTASVGTAAFRPGVTCELI